MAEKDLTISIVVTLIFGIIGFTIAKKLYQLFFRDRHRQFVQPAAPFDNSCCEPPQKIRFPICDEECSALNRISQQQGFNYGYGIRNGPHFWSQKICTGTKQSPINIMSSNATVHSDRRCLNWSREYSIVPECMTLENDGTCVNLQGKWSQGCAPYFVGGPLSEAFELKMIKFRWGPNRRSGSEHTIQNQRFAMEVQAIHYKKGLDDLCQALNCEKVVIVSFLYQDSKLDNVTFTPILNSLSKISCPGNSCRLAPFPVSLIIPPFLNNFYMYNGSLTFPPCTENVKWIVQPEPLTIHDKQVERFRQLNSYDGKIVNNVRPIQKLNCRDIYFYK